MPMQAPNLDDRTYAQLVAEAKTLIPRYAPEWTDQNETDPGITLIEMFSWMTEMLLYRLNQVPELNYIKFLQLLGIELKPAQPASAELTFTLARDDIETVIVPKGTQVAASQAPVSATEATSASAGGDQPLVFETETALIALGAKLKALQVFDGFSYSRQTVQTTPGQWFYPFGPKAREGSALMLGFDSPLDFTSEQVNLAVLLYSEGLKPEGKHCELDLPQTPLAATLEWEFWDGRDWEPLSLDKDETRAFTRSGHIYFTGPGNNVRKDRLGSNTTPYYWLRCRIVTSTYETPPRLEMVLTNTVRATQALTVRDEILGGSDGTPNQTFRLSNAPVAVLDKPVRVTRNDGLAVSVKSLRLEIDEGLGFQVWQEVDDFYASKPDDPHYRLNRTTGDVIVGNGRNGRIPVANPANPAGNVVARLYRYGGGKRSNTGTATLTQLQSSVESVDSVTNLRPAEGGSDEETVEEAKLRAPLQLKSKDRAVTSEDFEMLAIDTPGVRVRRAKALPLIHPKFPDAQIPGVVSVVVVPDSDAPNPLPSPATLAVVCAHLNKHRLLTSEVYVVPPTYHKVQIEIDVVAGPEADLAEVKRAVTDRLTNYFHPLKGGKGGTGWEFGSPIFYSEVYRIVLQVPGVSRIPDNSLIIWLDDERNPTCRDVPIGDGELLYSDGHIVRVTYES